MVAPMNEMIIPWAIAFGNHDDLASGHGGTREDLIKFDMSFPLSVSKQGPSSIHGVSNYAIEVWPGDLVESAVPAAFLYILDSGDSASSCGVSEGSGCIHPDQVQWYRQLSADYRNKFGVNVPGFAFFHIPLQEYLDLWNGDRCFGYNNDSISCQALNCGIFSAFLEEGNVRAVFVGHNHGNDFCGNYAGIQLCYGRHTGYGGYGDWKRGARIIEMSLIDQQQWTYDTWIRYEDGVVEARGPSHDPAPPYQGNC